MNYTLHQLQIFVEVVRRKSVTKAANELNISQPALSIQLRNFQEQFDQPLTEIHSRKLFVTDFGRDIAEIAEAILMEAESLHYKTKEYNGLITGRLRISSASTGKYVMPYFLTEFHHKYPGIDIVLDVTNKTRVVNALESNLIDFALVSVLPKNAAVFEEILLDNRLYLVGNKPEYDENKTLIFREKGSATRTSMDAYFKKQSQRKKIELTSNEAVKQAVIAGLGYSVLPLIGIRNEIDNQQLFIIERKGLPIITKWRLIWLKKKKLSLAAQTYIAYVQQHKKDIINNDFDWFLNKANEL